MVDFQAEDPITGTSYDPLGDPSGTAMKFVMAVLGISMTLLALGVAQSTVLPTLSGLFESVTGVNSGSGSGIVQFGDP